MASLGPWLVLAPTIGLAIDIVVHLVVTWILPLRKLYPRLLIGALLGGVATVGVTYAAADARRLDGVETLAFLAFNAATFGALSFGYFNFVQLNVSALRVRILNELFDLPEGIDTARLTAEYSAIQIVDQRLQRLVRGRQIESRDGRYYSRFSLVYAIALAMDTVKWAVLNRRIRDSFKRTLATQSDREPTPNRG